VVARDFYSSGHYLELEENKKVIFQWRSNTDPGPTEVTVTVKEKAAAAPSETRSHRPRRPIMDDAGKRIPENWEDSLENLKSVLETGIDLRIANRPMLGILPGDFTPEQASALGVPVREGMRLDGVVDGMGAQKAGLQRDDVLVKMEGNPITSDFNSLGNALLPAKKAARTWKWSFYRGPEKKTVTMELSKRPMPDVPFDPAELAKKARANYWNPPSRNWKNASKATATSKPCNAPIRRNGAHWRSWRISSMVNASTSSI
jgi:hypothetical protein